MRKVINGVRCFTDKAIPLGLVTLGGDQDSPHFQQFTLYATSRSGKFFAHGLGGILTAFAGSGEDIVLLTEEQAYRIVQECFDWEPEQYFHWFKKVPEYLVP